MRERFYQLATEALWENDRVAVVLAAIGAAKIAEHPRRFNVGIREQLMIGVAAGLALEGYRPIVHSYTPFLVERPYESAQARSRPQRSRRRPRQLRRVVRRLYRRPHASGAGGRRRRSRRFRAGRSRCRATSTRWSGCSPARSTRDDRVYIRLTDETNRTPMDLDGLTVVRRGNDDAPFVIAVGPTLDEVLEATADTGETVAYLATVRPFDADGLRKALRGTDVVLVEPYLAGHLGGRDLGGARRPPAPAALARRPAR